ncbi:MAG: hypothetical protein CHACPFDD_01120 [Phycisphaerae bacterium]|nr:hypothetical protein [Phycisphaerae bacterium]
MSIRQWIALTFCGGLVLQLASCAADLGYYLMDAFADYLPTLLDAWLGSITTSA